MWQQNNNLKHIFYNMTVRETFALCSTKSYRSLIELWKKSVIARLFYLNNSSLFLCTQNSVTFNCKPLQCYHYRLHFNQKWSIQDLKYWSQWSDISSTNAFQWQRAGARLSLPPMAIKKAYGTWRFTHSRATNQKLETEASVYLCALICIFPLPFFLIHPLLKFASHSVSAHKEELRVWEGLQ